MSFHTAERLTRANFAILANRASRHHEDCLRAQWEGTLPDLLLTFEDMIHYLPRTMPDAVPHKDIVPLFHFSKPLSLRTMSFRNLPSIAQ
jgi:hypothetical protein